MPIWIAYVAGAGAVGYVGAKIDDVFEWWNGPVYPTPQESALKPLGINWGQAFVFAAMGLALVWGARKAGVLK